VVAERCFVKQFPKPSLRLPELVLDRLALGKIGHERKVAPERTAIIAVHVEDDLDRHRGAVFPDVLLLEPDRTALLVEPLQLPAVGGSERFRGQVVDRHAPKIGGGKARQLLEGRVGEDHSTLGVRHDERLRGRFQEPEEQVSRRVRRRQFHGP